MRLLHLQLSRDVIQTTILAEMRSRLFEMEPHVGSNTLLSNTKHPIIIADTGIMALLTTYRHLVAPTTETITEVNAFQQRFADDGLMLDGKLAVEWQPFVNSPLVLHRAADGDMLVAIAPVLRQTSENPFWPLCNHEKMQVTTPVNHQPGILAPLVGFLDEEVRRKACPH